MARSIKINVSYSEHTNTLYYCSFQVVDKLPSVGEEYEDGVVAEIEEISKDPEQPNDEARDMDCYLVRYKDEEGEENEGYLAISSTKPNHTEPVLVFDGLLPPSAEAASLLLTEAINSKEGARSVLADDLAPDLCRADEDECLLEAFFGITPEIYEEVVTSVFADPVKKKLVSADGRLVMFEADLNGIEIRMEVPYWQTKEDCLRIGTDLADAMVKDGRFADRTIEDVPFPVLSEIIEGVMEVGETWFSEEGYPAWFGLISLNTDEVASICKYIIDICCKPFKELLKDLGYTQASFCRRYHFPKRTVQDWCMGVTPCRIYLRLMFAELEGLLPSHKR